MEEAVAYYNGLVAEDKVSARAQYDALHAAMQSRNVLYAGRPMATLLRPYLISQEQEKVLQHAALSIMTLAQKAERALFAGDSDRVYDFLGFSEAERRLVRLDPGYATPVVFTRLDGFLNGADLKLVEFNNDSPGGIGYSDQMTALFQELPLVAQLAQRYPLSSPPIRPVLLEALLQAYRQYGGAGRPAIAIVDWAEVKTRPDFEIIQDFFRVQGLSCLIADPRALAWRNGRLYSEDTAIDLVYRRVLLSELLPKLDEVSAFIRAYENRAACFINSFRCRRTENKSFFQFFTDPDYASLFTVEEQACLRRYIPWTRRVVAGFTDLYGERIDLCEYVLNHRERFVLKPNDAYGGQGVCVGSDADAGTWARTLDKALTGHWVAQERVTIPAEPFPVIDGETVAFCDMKVNVGPYYIGGRYCGSIARTSLSSVINVGAGGGSVPTFVVRV